MTFEEIGRLALALPGVESSTSYGTPAFKVRGKFLIRLHPDGLSLVIPVSFDEREQLMQAEPSTFYITEHYRRWPTMLVSRERIDATTLTRLFEQAWREKAGKKAVTAFDAKRRRGSG